MDKIMAENLKNKWIDENPRKPFPHDTVVTWYDLGKMLCVEHNTQKVIFKFLVCEKEYKLYLSFPEIGGVRLYANFVGFHSARQNKKIEIFGSTIIARNIAAEEIFKILIATQKELCNKTTVYYHIYYDVFRSSTGFAELYVPIGVGWSVR